ncbi:cytoskeletal protein CcmA (bactofilin family) [Sporosarcina luteola]|nr:cytoskeletal protein CcmA (bactofilin family) [Sporosarcina luteola]
MESEKIKVKGYAKYDQDISPDTFTSLGQSILKSIRTNDFNNSGTCMVKGSCVTKVLTNLGSATIRKLEADQIHSSGSLQVAESVKANTFQAKGHVTIKEELEAQFIHLTMTTASHVCKMSGAKEIIIRSHPVSFVNFFGLGGKRLKSRRIEGEVICLEYTVADVVIGESVTVGKGCELKEVHYTKTLDIHPDSKVGSTIKRGEKESENCL